jgi:hypothetical protein
LDPLKKFSLKALIYTLFYYLYHTIIYLFFKGCDIARDKQGLEYAFMLKRQIDTIAEQLKCGDLPESITIGNMVKDVKKTV